MFVTMVSRGSARFLAVLLTREKYIQKGEHHCWCHDRISAIWLERLIGARAQIVHFLKASRRIAGRTLSPLSRFESREPERSSLSYRLIRVRTVGAGVASEVQRQTAGGGLKTLTAAPSNGLVL